MDIVDLQQNVASVDGVGHEGWPSLDERTDIETVFMLVLEHYSDTTLLIRRRLGRAFWGNPRVASHQPLVVVCMGVLRLRKDRTWSRDQCCGGVYGRASKRSLW